MTNIPRTYGTARSADRPGTTGNASALRAFVRSSFLKYFHSLSTVKRGTIKYV